MGVGTRVKNFINRGLAPLNLRLSTLTAERRERDRLQWLATDKGQFDGQVFSLSRAWEKAAPDPILSEVRKYRGRIETFRDPSMNDVGYAYDNGFFSSPDAEVLYALVRRCCPGTIVEVGSGYSTRVMRQAIIDGALNSRLVSVDPQPRADIDHLADEVFRAPVESLKDEELFSSLGPGDMLFIDSSHMVATGNDVCHLYLKVLPMLRPGVLVHVHDVFLPYEYPSSWILQKGIQWQEQYLLQAILVYGDYLSVIWAGHLWQRTVDQFGEYFPNMGERLAQSMWFCVGRDACDCFGGQWNPKGEQPKGA